MRPSSFLPLPVIGGAWRASAWQSVGRSPPSASPHPDQWTGRIRMTEDESQPSSSLRPANRILTASCAARLMLSVVHDRSLESPRPATLNIRPARLDPHGGI